MFAYIWVIKIVFFSLASKQQACFFLVYFNVLQAHTISAYIWIIKIRTLPSDANDWLLLISGVQHGY